MEDACIGTASGSNDGRSARWLVCNDGTFEHWHAGAYGMEATVHSIAGMGLPSPCYCPLAACSAGNV